MIPESLIFGEFAAADVATPQRKGNLTLNRPVRLTKGTFRLLTFEPLFNSIYQEWQAAKSCGLPAGSLRHNTAETTMATSVSASASNSPEKQRHQSGRLHGIRAFWRDFIATAFNSYRPELHYMRGPGPAWRARHGERPPERSE